jgi:hypothetical protein
VLRYSGDCGRAFPGARLRSPTARSREPDMYIGGGTILLILIIVLIVVLLRRR